MSPVRFRPSPLLPGRLEAYLDEVLASGAATALAVAVTDGDETVLVRTRGEAAEHSLFEIGSIGKSFTAILMLQLAEEGLLALDAPVTEYLPWFSVRSAHRPISVHDLLTHTSGVIRGSEIATASNFDVVALANTETGFAPGEHFWYSNVGYRALGLVLEAVSRRSYPELVRARILEPLDLEDATPSIVHDVRRRLAPLAMPFYDDRPWRPEHGLVPATWIESAEADGCICCSAPALARYLRALMARDERLLPAERFASLLTDHVEDDQDRGRYGYGIAFMDGGFGHGGGMIGHFATMWARPDRGRGVVVLANGVAPTDRIADAVLAVLDGEEPKPFAVELHEALVDDGSAPAEWQPFLGHYRSHNPWLSNFRVLAREGRLWWVQDAYENERGPLTLLDDGRFRIGEQAWSPERLSFDTEIDGKTWRAWCSGAAYHRAFTS